MKKTYEGLEMEVIRFSTEDIITTSEAKTTENNQQTNNQTSTQDQTGTNVLAPTQDQEDSGIIVDNGTTYYPTDQNYNGNKLYYKDGEDPNYPAWFQSDGKWVALG